MPLIRHGNGELMAVTSLDASAVSPKVREKRNKGKATARSGKQGHRRANHMETGKPVSGPDVSEWER